MGKIYVGDVDTEFIAETGSDLTSATQTDIEVLKPDGSEMTWTGTVIETENIRYLSKPGDLDQAGVYARQAVVTLPGWRGRGETTYFTVFDKFK